MSLKRLGKKAARQNVFHSLSAHEKNRRFAL